MALNRGNPTLELVRDVRQAHEWVMIGGFTMLLGGQNSTAPEHDCMIQPVAVELKGYGLQDALLNEMCAKVEHAGESMRADCPAGSLNYVNVRVHINRQAMHSVSARLPWQYFITHQIASSESDSLNGIDDPRCYIDLHVFQQS